MNMRLIDKDELIKKLKELQGPSRLCSEYSKRPEKRFYHQGKRDTIEDIIKLVEEM